MKSKEELLEEFGDVIDDVGVGFEPVGGKDQWRGWKREKRPAKVGGHPMEIEQTNRQLKRMTEHAETAAIAMRFAISKEERENTEAMIMGKIARPRSYKEDMPVRVYRYLSDHTKCWTLKAIALTMGVEEKLFVKWMEQHDALAYAVDVGRAQQEVNFGSMLLHGFKYSSGVEYILTNLHGWSTKQRTEHALDLNAAIAAQEAQRNPVKWIDQDAGGMNAKPSVPKA